MLETHVLLVLFLVPIINSKELDHSAGLNEEREGIEGI